MCRRGDRATYQGRAHASRAPANVDSLIGMRYHESVVQTIRPFKREEAEDALDTLIDTFDQRLCNPQKFLKP